MFKKIKVGIHEFDIVPNPVLKASDGALGICNAAALEIQFIPHKKSSIERDVIFHEVLHAIWWAQGLKDLDDPDLEERIVSALTPLLLDTIDRNPAFRDLVAG